MLSQLYYSDHGKHSKKQRSANLGPRYGEAVPGSLVLLVAVEDPKHPDRVFAWITGSLSRKFHLDFFIVWSTQVYKHFSKQMRGMLKVKKYMKNKPCLLGWLDTADWDVICWLKSASCRDGWRIDWSVFCIFFTSDSSSLHISWEKIISFYRKQHKK